MTFDWNTILIFFGALSGFGVIYAILKYILNWFFKRQQIKGVQDFQETSTEYDAIIERFLKSDKSKKEVNKFLNDVLVNIKTGKIDLEYLLRKLEKEQ